MAVAIAVFAPELTPAFLTAAVGTSTAVAITTAVLSVVASIALGVAFKALGIGSVPSAKQQVGPPSVFRQSITDSFIVYGKRRVGGLLVFFHSSQVGNDHFRYFVIAHAGHQCKQLDSYMLNDDVCTLDGSNKVTNTPYKGGAWLWFVRGTDTDAANATFISECGGNWTSAHQGKGVAKTYAKFKMTDDVTQAGMPNITAVIEGKDDILDTRTSTEGYTDNAALVFYDWLKMLREEGGFGAYPDEIPDDTWISAQANVCDETVDGEARYAIDAVITTGDAPGQVRDAMVVNMAGTYTFSAGKHLMRPGYWVPPSATLKEDDLAAGIQVSPFVTADQAINQVQGSFIDPNNGYQGQAFTTQITLSSDVRQQDLDLAFITSLKRANRIAKIMLGRAGCEKTVVWPMNIAGLGVRALDTVQLDTTRYGLNNYAWVVSNWGLSSDYGVVISLREENAEIYDDVPTGVPATPNTIVQPGPLTPLQQIQSALRSTYTRGMIMDAIDAGSNATIRLHGTTTADPFIIDYPSGADPTVGPISITGLSYATIYYPYMDVAGVGDAAPTFGATTVYSDALNSATNPYRIFLGRSVTTPAAGGGTTTGGGTGSGYGGGGGFTGGGGGGSSYP